MCLQAFYSKILHKFYCWCVFKGRKRTRVNHSRKYLCGIYEFWQLEMAEFPNEIFKYGSLCFSAVIPNMFNDLVSLKIHWTNWRTIYVWVFQISPSLALTTIVLTSSLSNNPRANLVLWRRNIDWMQSIELNSRIFGCNSHQLDLHVLQSRKCFTSQSCTFANEFDPLIVFAKGQLISKCLFGDFKFFHKTSVNKLT